MAQTIDVRRVAIMTTATMDRTVDKIGRALRISLVVLVAALVLWALRDIILVGMVTLLVLVVAGVAWYRWQKWRLGRAQTEAAAEAETYLGQSSVRLMRPDEARPEMLGGAIFSIVPGQDIITTTRDSDIRSADRRTSERKQPEPVTV